MKKRTPPTKKLHRMKGVIDVTRRGKGFLLHPDGDILVPREKLGGALPGDIVEIVIIRRGNFVSGNVVQVLERKRNSFVGELLKTPLGVVLRPDNPRVYFDFLVVGSPGAPVGHKAVIDVVEWDDRPPKAKVRSVLGKAGEHDTEMRAIVASRGFESDFPQPLINEAEKLYEHAWDENEIKARRDFRNVTTFTIDPDTAKDFDDAISYQELPQGLIEVGIHIADVTHFVRPGSLLDQEAGKRGTSVYLVDRTIPMLPPQLSEDLCSLKPDTDRLAFSAVFVFKGKKVTQRWFGKSIIRSQKRLTYDDADAFLKKTFSHSQEYENVKKEKEKHRIETALLALWGIASYLREERLKKGAIMFALDEVRPTVDGEGVVTGFKRSRYTESHQLIEELMLLANREVAGLVSKHLGRKSRLFVYRIHDVPNEEKLDELAVFLRAIGYQLSLGERSVSQKEINKILKEAKGKPEERLITTVTIRSMAKAVYATKNIGHYGLAFDDYAHFTSPIRRYPDIMVHRTLETILRGGKVHEKPEEIEQKAVHASEREAGAAEAERESVRLKQVEYLAKKIGEEREGVVSGATEWGVYIEDTETGGEGMVRLASLTDDTYEYNPRKFTVVGASSKKTIRVGDAVKFRIEAADIEGRLLDYALI